jgi:hypothetical protein
MTKKDRRESFGDMLSSTLGRVIDFLKFAETKNAALLTFASAWTFAAFNTLNGEHPPVGIVGGAFRLALVLFAVAAVVAVISFLPKLDLNALHRDPAQPKNLLYFGHIAEFDTAVFCSRVKERYLAQGEQSITDEYLDDLTVQISANSKIARQKFIMFNIGAWLVLLALLALALAALSTTIYRASAGVLLWG